MKLIGDVPWAKMNADNEIGRALKRTYEVMNIPHGEPRKEMVRSAAAARRPAATGRRTCSATARSARRSPSFTGVPIVGGGAGNGGRAHAANEYYVIEGAGKVYGMAGAEKAVATLVYAFAGKIPPAPAKPATTN